MIEGRERWARGGGVGRWQDLPLRIPVESLPDYRSSQGKGSGREGRREKMVLRPGFVSGPKVWDSRTRSVVVSLCLSLTRCASHFFLLHTCQSVKHHWPLSINHPTNPQE